MQLDGTGYQATVDEAAQQALAAEREGLDRFWVTEIKADAFLEAAIAAERTERIGIGTNIAVALARSPMTVAVQANDVQRLSQGRFALGLGAQVKGHIERRFSMPYDRPAARMREFICAVRAIWAAWAGEAELAFEGEFYTHTLMTPMFDPGPNPHGTPPILLAAVGPLMTQVAAEVADGILLHGFTTERYLREQTLPALGRGAAAGGRTLEGFDVVLPCMVAAEEDPGRLAELVEMVRGQIAFYGSTPTYRRVLEHHGWEAAGERLTAMSKRGEWDAMASVVTDEMVDAFAVVGTPADAARELDRRFGDVVTRLTLPDALSGPARQALAGALRAAA